MAAGLVKIFACASIQHALFPCWPQGGALGELFMHFSQLQYILHSSGFV